MCASSSRLSSTADWICALTLRERHSLAQTGRHTEKSQGSSPAVTVDRWRTELSITDDADYSRWLEENGWDDTLLRELLAFPRTVDAEKFDYRPAWLVAIDEAYRSSPGRDTHVSPLERLELPAYRRVFLTLAEPLILRGITQVQEVIAGATAGRSSPFDHTTVHELLLPSLMPQLALRLNRALTLELHVARLQGLLEGESPETRFAAFGTLLMNADHATALLREYPVLARQLAECVGQWVDCSIEMLLHLHSDWPEIKACFAKGNDPGQLIEVTGGAGDTHRNGRSVHIMMFESGLRLVYKPRSMDVEIHFHELLRWTNCHGFELAFWTPKLLPRRDYGWSEFIEGRDCDSLEELERFYERQGGLLALLYALEGVDFHRENLIAAGEHPVLVDLEALFHPRPTLPNGHVRSRRRIYDRMRCTVLRVGLLPRRDGDSTPLAKYDGSGLGGTENQLSPYSQPRFEKVATDQMRIVRQHVKLPKRNNRPRLNGVHANAYTHREAIVRGFSKVHALLRRDRQELLCDGGPIVRFADDEIRVVLRGTASYARVLVESSHPSLLTDAADHERLLQRLRKAAVHAPHLTRVLDEEIMDLQSGNIPLFTSHPRSRHLWSSRRTRISDFFEQSSLENVKQRIACLDEADLELQIWLIRASLTALSSGSHNVGGHGVPARRVEWDRPATGTDLIRAAQSVGERLHETALREDGLTSWFGVSVVPEGDWTLEPVGFDLFAGTAGIALFLGYLGKITGQERHTELASALVEEAGETLLTESIADFASIGVFAGPSGWLYTLAHLAHLHADSGLLDWAHQIRRRVIAHVGADNALDVIKGSAGLIGGLAALYRCDPTAELLNDITRCANHIVQRAECAEGGIAWRTDVPARAPLTGFSHGASGIAWALFEAAALTGRTDYIDVARAGMQYERAVFIPQLANWPDFRKLSGEASGSVPHVMTAWCHGAPGIGLARLRALKCVADSELRSDLDHALATTIAQGFGANHSICHGDLGNVQLVAEAGAVLGRPQLTRHAAEISGRIVAAIHQAGPICGTPGAIETPGLMVGLAGIGFGLLRLAEPDRVPLVLTLDPPQFFRPAETVPSTSARSPGSHSLEHGD